jgi:hypothetical protein
LNLVIYELCLFSWLLISKKIEFKNLYQKTLLITLILSSVNTVITFSTYAYIIHFIILILFIGIQIHPNSKSLSTAMGMGFFNILDSQRTFFKSLFGKNGKSGKQKVFFRSMKLFFIPLLIILLFVFIYRNSAPVFDQFISGITSFFRQKFEFIFTHLNFTLILTFILSLLISVFLLYRTINYWRMSNYS